MTRVLVVGDIGQPVYHVGDEAMTISTAEYLADAGMQVILATRDADQSKRYLGAEVCLHTNICRFYCSRGRLPSARSRWNVSKSFWWAALCRICPIFARRRSISAIL